jgi:hypothetical protein
MTKPESVEYFQTLAKFFQAIGREGEPIAFTAFGGEGGNWHFEKNADGSAKEVEVSDANLEKLATHGKNAREKAGHQLGFYLGRGGSKAAQLTTIPCLKAESDHCPTEDQLLVYKEFENCYGVKFTMIQTGGKSIHAYLRIEPSILAEDYKKICAAFQEKLREIGEHLDVNFIPDMAMINPAQAMRLPGAIHRKTGKIAEVLQYGEPTTLEQIELDSEAIKQIHHASLSRSAIGLVCQNQTILGYEGEEGEQVLASIAEAWPKRIPGTGTYSKVVPLVGGLTQILGSEKAALILFQSRHNDPKGEPSLEGIKTWCQSFQKRQENDDSIKARLIEKAERLYGWQRPKPSPNSVILKITETTETEEDIYQIALSGGGVLVHNTGEGKSKNTITAIRDQMDAGQIQAYEEGRKSKLSALISSPRTILNGQNARYCNGYNVSSSKKKQAALPNVYCACPKSLGRLTKLNGDPMLWVESMTAGDVPGGAPSVPSLAGMPAVAYLVIDEHRQQMEMMLLSTASIDGDTLWSSPKEHLDKIRNLFITIENAVYVYSLDAQMGKVDLDLLKLLRPGKPDSARIIGNKPKMHGGTFHWTGDKKEWTNKLLTEVIKEDRQKPIICIVAFKGNQADYSSKSLSAWSIKYLIEKIPIELSNASYSAVVIDGDNKDQPEQQMILQGKPGKVDVVICTTVAQSGFSWINTFHSVGFVAGGETLPPNIIGGQAGRRERTLKDCIAFLPETVYSGGLPFNGDIRKEAIHQQLVNEHIDNGFKINRLDAIILEAQAAYSNRRIIELYKYREFALTYAMADGWLIAQLLPCDKKIKLKKEQSTKKSQTRQLLDWESLSLCKQQILLAMYGQLSIDELSQNHRKWIEGGAGIDLIISNLPSLAKMLIESELIRICDGNKRAKEDSLVIHCSKILSSQEATKLLTACGPLKCRLDRAVSMPDNECNMKRIGSVVRALGGVRKTTKGTKALPCAWELPMPPA